MPSVCRDDVGFECKVTRQATGAGRSIAQRLAKREHSEACESTLLETLCKGNIAAILGLYLLSSQR